MCSSRISEIPVENFVNQSKIETLQWQLKEIQKSREMYRAVMKQVVTFLEKAHHSLELLGCRMNRKNSVTRSKSEHQIVLESTRGHNDVSTLSTGLNGCLDDYLSFKDWRQTKEDAPSPDEVPPRSSPRRPSASYEQPSRCLTHVNRTSPRSTPSPSTTPSSWHSWPGVPQQQQHARAQAPPRRLLLAQPQTDLARDCVSDRPRGGQDLHGVQQEAVAAAGRDEGQAPAAVRRTAPGLGQGSVADSDTESPGGKAGKSEEKPASPATGSVSSMEDERVQLDEFVPGGGPAAGEFHHLGRAFAPRLTQASPTPALLPLWLSAGRASGIKCKNMMLSVSVAQWLCCGRVSTKTALLRSMLHNNSDYNSLNFSSDNSSSTDTTILSNGSCGRQELSQRKPVDEFRLWQKPSPTVHPAQHKRWNSSPSEDIRKQSLKVLWV
ncbi:hypothetical protein NQ318_016751 [Aromia moschata]|uniref:Uncharacterized protein n=1 Tax=Aromia moschata TaxID=1265417 RepID=A0AAV8Y5J0_9CUCU|nr:hypothetical protein NQ318_016751 [Aromia moschata]